MRIDWYTKAVLTVIAVCLIWLSLGGPSLLPPVQAQSTNNRVVIEGWLDTAGKVHTPAFTNTPPTEAMPVAVLYSVR
jgi:hypothetical protein